MPTHTLPPPGWEIVDSGDEAEQNEFEYLQHPEVGPKSFYGTLYPVFLTAKIPVDTLNRCLSRCADYQFNWDRSGSGQLFLVPSDAGKQPSGFIPTFKVESSPTTFIGWTVEQVRTHFIQHWQIPDGHREWPRRPNRSFVILDERTIQDDTALLVAINGQEKGPIEVARSEFDCIVQVFFWVDDGDKLDAEKFEGKRRGMENGMLVYRVEWFKMDNAKKHGWQFEIDYEESDDEGSVWGWRRDENGFDPQHPNYAPMHDEFGPDNYKGVLYPVFLTAQLPLETVSRCITRNADYQANWDDSESGQLYLVNSSSGKPSSGFIPTFKVEQSFQPPDEFIGKTVEDIRAHFVQYWRRPEFYPEDWPQLPTRCFVVLDEQTLKDDTALLVAINDKENGPMELARSEFDCICQALKLPDSDGVDLGKQEYAQTGRGVENGLLVYRVRWFKKKIGADHGYITESGVIDYDGSDDEGFVWGTEVDENGFRDGHPEYDGGEDDSDTDSEDDDDDEEDGSEDEWEDEDEEDAENEEGDGEEQGAEAENEGNGTGKEAGDVGAEAKEKTAT